MAVSNPPPITTPMPITAPSKIFGSRPELLRRVSMDSFLLSGQTVELTGQSSRESGLVGIRTKWGALYDLPKEFLLKPGEPEPEPIKLEALRVSKKLSDAAMTPQSERKSFDEPVSKSPAPPVIPEATPEAMIQSSKAMIQAPDPEPVAVVPSVEPPMVAKLPPGVVVKKLESGEEVVVARDGTYRPINANPYRGSRQIAAQQALGKQYGTRTEIKCDSGMVTVTLVQPTRRDAESIRAEVLRKIVAAATDGEFMSVCQKLRATKAERSLADRIRALRNVGTKSEDEWDVRRRIGVNIREIRSR